VATYKNKQGERERGRSQTGGKGGGQERNRRKDARAEAGREARQGRDNGQDSGKTDRREGEGDGKERERERKRKDEGARERAHAAGKRPLTKAQLPKGAAQRAQQDHLLGPCCGMTTYLRSAARARR
jgi:hypothetical protein